MKVSIIGGTGTLGKELTRQILKRFPSYAISILSRCELKQQKMKEEFNDPRIRYHLADITQPDSLHYLNFSSIVFHVAALKHVDILEDNPESALKTNTIGTLNVINACNNFLIPKLIFFSTDKAVDPINAYGYSKALAEKILLNRNKQNSITTSLIYRWGNIIGSSGSILEVIKKTVESGKPIKITDFNMSRFWLLIEDAVRFVLDTYLTADKNIIQIPENLKGARVIDLIDAYLALIKQPDYQIIKVPIRRGEKIFENMYSDHDKDRFLEWKNSKTCPQLNKDELKEIVKAWLCNSKF